MKHFNSVLAFGDSHVAGCELSKIYRLEDYTSGKITIEEADEPGKKLAFPKIIADKFNIPCYNYAMSGGSNARSLRLLIEAVKQYPNSLVLFGYTSSDRTEFYFPDTGNYLGRDKDNFIQVGMQWNGIKMQHPVNDRYLEILRPYNNLEQLMFIVDNICKTWAKKVLHIPLFPEKIITENNVLNFEGHKNYLDWCKVNEFIQLEFYHYEQKAHNKLAELIIKELT